mgnify:CR=1 FL=1
MKDIFFIIIIFISFSVFSVISSQSNTPTTEENIANLFTGINPPKNLKEYTDITDKLQLNFLKKKLKNNCKIKAQPVPQEIQINKDRDAKEEDKELVVLPTATGLSTNIKLRLNSDSQKLKNNFVKGSHFKHSDIK